MDGAARRRGQLLRGTVRERWASPLDPHLGDHRLGGRVVAAGMLQLAWLLEAARGSVSDVVFQAPLTWDDDGPRKIQVVEGSDGSLELHSRSEGWRLHATARVGGVEAPPSPAVPEVFDRPRRDLYAERRAEGFDFGPAYRWLEATGPGGALLRPAEGLTASALPVPPGLLDSALHAVTADHPGTWVPFALAGAHLARPWSGREVRVERGEIERPRLGNKLEQRLDLARERDAPRRMREVERLHAERVARDEHLSGPRVMDGDGEDAVEPPQHGGPFLEVETEHHLGVRSTPEGVPLRLELRPQLPVVVDLAVEDELHRPLRGPHRLVAERREVDDREAGMPEADARGAVDEDSLIVGAAMPHRLDAAVEGRLVESA